MKGDQHDIKKRKDKLEVKYYPLSVDLEDRAERIVRFFTKYKDFYDRQRTAAADHPR